MVTETESRQKLIALLQLAYSGELAAAYAYRGHWRSVSNEKEQAAIRAIELGLISADPISRQR